MQLPEDTYMHKGQRRKLLEELRTMGIRDEAVLDAMDRVPRHYFLDSAFSQFAYSNKAFPIAAGQTISQPHTVAKQSELLGAAPGANVLEIGTGSGYQCAVLCALGLKVHSIERQKALFDTMTAKLDAQSKVIASQKEEIENLKCLIGLSASPATSPDDASPLFDL